MRFGKKVRLCAALSLAACTGVAFAQTSGGASASEVQGLLNALGSQQGLTAINKRAAEVYGRAHACVPAATVQQTFADPRVEQQQFAALTAIYQRHFTSAEVKALTDFFTSPVGRKWLQQRPAIARETLQQGRQMGGERIKTMVTSLQKQGVLDAQGHCPASK